MNEKGIKVLKSGPGGKGEEGRATNQKYHQTREEKGKGDQNRLPESGGKKKKTAIGRSSNNT